MRARAWVRPGRETLRWLGSGALTSRSSFELLSTASKSAFADVKSTPLSLFVVVASPSACCFGFARLAAPVSSATVIWWSGGGASSLSRFLSVVRGPKALGGSSVERANSRKSSGRKNVPLTRTENEKRKKRLSEKSRDP